MSNMNVEEPECPKNLQTTEDEDEECGDEFEHQSPEPAKLSNDEIRCVKALKKLHLNYAKISVEFHKELHAMECRYAPRFAEVLKKREEITSGKHKPSDEDCDFEVSYKVLELKCDTRSYSNGLENFWLKVMENSSMLMEYIQEHDRPILQHLKDVQLEMAQDPPTFTLKFIFEPNDFFTNEVLTKKYYLKIDVSEKDPAAFEGIEFLRAEGCEIQWKEGKNPTVTISRKRQKHRTRGVVRTVTKSVKRSSFFHYFSPPTGVEEDLNEEEQYMLQCDFDVGHYFKERLIPFAVEYFTGELSDEEDDDDVEEESEEDDDDDVEHDSGDENNEGGNNGPSAKQQADCKQH